MVVYGYQVIVVFCHLYIITFFLITNTFLLHRFGVYFSMIMFHLGCSGHSMQNYRLMVCNLMFFLVIGWCTAGIYNVMVCLIVSFLFCFLPFFLWCGRGHICCSGNYSLWLLLWKASQYASDFKRKGKEKGWGVVGFGGGGGSGVSFKTVLEARPWNELHGYNVCHGLLMRF